MVGGGGWPCISKLIVVGGCILPRTDRWPTWTCVRASHSRHHLQHLAHHGHHPLHYILVCRHPLLIHVLFLLPFLLHSLLHYFPLFFIVLSLLLQPLQHAGFHNAGVISLPLSTLRPRYNKRDPLGGRSLADF